MQREVPRVLIADGDEYFVMYASILLNRMGISRVLPAQNGLEVKKLLKLILPEVVIINFDMPDIQADKLIGYIKSDSSISGIPVILTYDPSDNIVIHEFQDMGVSGFLSKPVKVNDLFTVLYDNIIFANGRKRKSIRAPYEKKILMKHNGITYEQHAVSLSEGGIYIRNIDPIEIGEKVDITLNLSGGDFMSLKGTVIYHRGVFGEEITIAPGMAVEFSDIKEHEAKALRHYITELLASDLIEEQQRPVIAI